MSIVRTARENEIREHRERVDKTEVAYGWEGG